MHDSSNPYVSPQALIGSKVKKSSTPIKRLQIAWAAVFFANLIVPVTLGLLPTDPVGRWGMGTAIGGMLICGWLFCYAFPVLGRKLIAGSILTALSQVLPIAQFAAGIAGLAIASGLGLFVSGKDYEADHFINEFGSFVATMTTGTILVVGALMLGWLVAFLLPKHWFYSSPVDNNLA